MSDQTLFGGDNSPALVDGYGPIPAEIARRLVDAAATMRGQRPHCGGCTAIRSPARWSPWSRVRVASQGLWRYSSGCAIEPVEHPIATRRFGTVTTRCQRTRADRRTQLNGLGMCAHCNFVKESPGWQVAPAKKTGPHRRIRDAHRRALPFDRTAAAGVRDGTVSEVEIRFGIELADLHAA